MQEVKIRKGERTKMMIVERAAHLFGDRGYFGTSMSELVSATRIEKGGIYNHFASKEEIALDAFEFAVSIVRSRFYAAVASSDHALDKLHALVDVASANVEQPPITGGCPVLKTASESASALPDLHGRVQAVVDEWLTLVRNIVTEGIGQGEVDPGVSADDVASVLVATFEGGVMLSQVSGDPSHVRAAVAHLHHYLDTAVRADARRGAD